MSDVERIFGAENLTWTADEGFSNICFNGFFQSSIAFEDNEAILDFFPNLGSLVRIQPKK
jgi:hypothetical protein